MIAHKVVLPQYDCATATTCKRVGPYFAGMSTETCDAHGGTWCPQPLSCQDLKTCLADMAGSSDDYPAFKDYLILAPAIDDETDIKQCGR